jgi:heat shock protein HslJ
MTAMTRLSFNTAGLARAEAATMPSSLRVISPDDPLSECVLAGRRWAVTEVADERVPTGLAPTLEFRSDGRMFGTAAVNRFTMDYVQDGWCVSVGLAFATRFAVDARQADFETRFFQCLETIRQFRRDEQTLSVIFETRDGQEIRTRPVLFR